MSGAYGDYMSHKEDLFWKKRTNQKKWTENEVLAMLRAWLRERGVRDEDVLSELYDDKVKEALDGLEAGTASSTPEDSTRGEARSLALLDRMVDALGDP